MNRYCFAALALASLALFACGGGDSTNSDGSVRLRLGYFPNLTHVQPQVGILRGTYEETLGPGAKLEAKTFNAGPSVIEALFAGEIDASYIGPNPAINGYIRSGGKELRIIAGATSAGALLVVRSDAGLEKPADFANRKVATPQL